MGKNIVEIQQSVRLCQLSVGDMNALLDSVHQAVLSTAAELGKDFFATAIISNSNHPKFKYKQAA